MELKYLKLSGNRISNGECSFNDNIQSLWEWGGATIEIEHFYCLSILFKDGSVKEFKKYYDYKKLIQDADNYLDEITNKK
jgi:hypothetical protein